MKSYSETHSPYTTKKAITRLRQIFKVAIADDYLAKSPAEKVTNLPRLSRQHEIKILESGEIRTLLAAVPDFWKPLIKIALRTGLRRGEIFGLRWDDVLWKERQVRVTFQLSGATLVEPKSHAARRKIDIGPATLDLLRAHMEQCPESELGLVFPNPTGKPTHAGNFQRDIWGPARNQACFPHLRFHDLRHTFASLLIHNRESVKYVQTVMGHADAQTTLNVYGHLFEGSGTEAASRLESALSDIE